MAEFDRLAAMSEDEVVTHSYVRDVPLRSGGVMALITLDNGKDHTRPSTLGPVTLLEFEKVLDEQKERAARKEIKAVGVTGKPFIFAAGADLSKVNDIPDRETGKQMAQLGHQVLGKLSDLGVPSFVFYNGLALGGGIEIGLNATYRTVDSSAAGLALPEVFLGIIPGWGGAWLLPNLIGIENALKVIIENPLKQNRMMTPQDAFDLGVADAIFPPATFLEDSIAWADEVISGKTKVKRSNAPGKIERAVKWDVALGIARKTLESRIGTIAKSPYAALDLMKAGEERHEGGGLRARGRRARGPARRRPVPCAASTRSTSCRSARRSPPARPDKALGAPGQQGRHHRRGAHGPPVRPALRAPPAGAGGHHRPRPGPGGRGRRLDPHRDRQPARQEGRISPDEANRLKALVHGTTNKADFADCDWVIEAIFEELGAKQEVFAEVEKYISPEAILATNTSSLSVEQIGAKLEHPERVVGFHFFNPVAVMPLIEVVRTPHTTDEALSTAMVTAEKLRKNAVITKDTPGFVRQPHPREAARRGDARGRHRHAVRGGRQVRSRRSGCR